MLDMRKVELQFILDSVSDSCYYCMYVL